MAEMWFPSSKAATQAPPKKLSPAYKAIKDACESLAMQHCVTVEFVYDPLNTGHNTGSINEIRFLCPSHDAQTAILTRIQGAFPEECITANAMSGLVSINTKTITKDGSKKFIAAPNSEKTLNTSKAALGNSVGSSLPGF